MDAGYTNCKGFLAPFRGQCYHLSQWKDGPQPTTAKEYFNMKHSSARNMIERYFRVLKNRWAILRSPAYYPVKTQNRIIMACCLLHNLIRREMPTDPVEQCLEEVTAQDLIGANGDPITTIETFTEWSTWRDNLDIKMFNEWRASRQGR